MPVIVVPSSSVYGANPTLPKHEGLLPRPRSPYAASKLATEAYALAYGGKHLEQQACTVLDRAAPDVRSAVGDR